MNAKVSSIAIAHRTPAEIESFEGGSKITFSPQLSGRYDLSGEVLWVTWSPAGIPSFNVDLLLDLERASRVVESHFLGWETARPLHHIVLRSGNRAAFSVGGDLNYFHNLILAKDRARLTEYARSAVNVVYSNHTAHNLRGATTVALLEGDALGGGFECALSCDVIIAERHVKAGFPEILFNMFPGMGGMSFLARRTSKSVAEEMVRSGRQYGAEELLKHGVVDQVVDTGLGVEAVHKLMRRREQQTAGHAAINAVDRIIRPITREELHEISRLWVDCAMQLSPRGLEWMQRLYLRQVSIFGSRNIATGQESAGTAAAAA